MTEIVCNFVYLLSFANRFNTTESFSKSESVKFSQFHRKIQNLAFSESGSSTNSNKNQVVFGQATHVGCGWIQFPTSTSTKDSKVEDFFHVVRTHKSRIYILFIFIGYFLTLPSKKALWAVLS